ncbi:8129_t:CDS:2 [Acaulospora morrowiae]|uniref:8129_t:CDS:1 n=1 Tax=Acaulospora morrowiae TaxID=94023 RepID=A0A9N9GX64_9GLOM|nr:8129_t:CDS:2 [Acaulospora morrowiae]
MKNFLGGSTSSPPSSGTEYIPSSEPPEDAQSEVPSEISIIEASSYSAHVASRGRCLFLLMLSFLQGLFFVLVVLVALLKLIGSEKLLKVILPVLTVEDVGLTMKPLNL